MKLLLFGAASPIGQCIINYCQQENFQLIKSTHHLGENTDIDCNCLNKDRVFNTIDNVKPTHIISLVGYNGNIDLNKREPGTICGETVRMNMNVMDAAIYHKIKKVLIPLSSCSYSVSNDSLKEENYTKGEIHESVVSHGFARRFLYVYGQQLNKQFGNRFIFPIINNCFGTTDYWNRPEKLKVFGTLIKRFVEAQRNNTKEVEIWGTGMARREGLLFSEAGRLITEMLLTYEDYSLPLNIGYGTDLYILQLCDLIKKTSGYQGKIVFNPSKPEGQMKKLLDVSRFKQLGYECKSTLEQGIIDTVNWYRENM